MKHLAVALLAIACAPVAPQASHTPSPPPSTSGLVLTAEGLLEAGTTIRLRVDGATPGSNIFLLRSSEMDANRTCPPILAGQCLDLVQPRVMARLTANSAGRAQRVITVPSGVPDGAVAWFQAVAMGVPPLVSDAVPRFNPRDSNALAVRTDQEQATITGSSYAGTLKTAWTSIYAHGLDACAFSFSSQGIPTLRATPCSGCTFAFDVEYFSPEEVSLAGDCVALMGVDASALPFFINSIGLIESYYFDGYGPLPAAVTYDVASSTWLPFAAGNDVDWNGSDFRWYTRGGFYEY